MCEDAVAELRIDHASILVMTGRRAWSPGAATSGTATMLEEYAFTVGEGPCHAAVHEHLPVIVTDLSEPGAIARWPVWVGAAEQAGVRAVTALPIEAGAITAGVLSLYAASVWQPDRTQLATARLLTDRALLALLDMAASLGGGDGGPDHDGRDGTDLSVLLRADVHRAAGMIMVQADVPIDEALVRLRAHAFGTGRALPEVAADVLAHRLRFDADVGWTQ